MNKLFCTIWDRFRDHIGIDEIEKTEKILRDPMGWYFEDFDRDVAAIADDNLKLDDITNSLETVYQYLNIFMPSKRADTVNPVSDVYRDFLKELRTLHVDYDYPKENIERLIDASYYYVFYNPKLDGRECPTNYEMFCKWFEIEEKEKN